MDGPDPDRALETADRLRELEASGMSLPDLLNGPAGAAFVQEDCGGDIALARAAFALVHPSARFVRANDEGVGRERRGLYLPPGYRLDETSDTELTVLRREDGSEVAVFGETPAVDEVEQAAWKDRRRS